MQKSEEYNQKYRSVQQCYLQSLPDKLKSIENLWSSLDTVNWNFGELKRMQEAVHQIAGSAAGFGLTELSSEAKALDKIVLNSVNEAKVPNFHTKEQIEQHLEQMKLTAGFLQTTPSDNDSSAHAGLKILIIDEDHQQTALIEKLCQAQECQAVSIHSLKLAPKAIEHFHPDLILMDVVFPEGELAGVEEFIKLHSQIGLITPVIFMSSRNDLSARVRSYRAGGSGYLTKPFTENELKLQLDLIHNHRSHHARILIVDKHEQSNQELLKFLKSQGHHCTYCHNPAIIIHLLEKYPPDLLILDLDSPHYSDEILRVLRQETRYMQLPILQLTSNHTTHVSDMAIAHGASGVIHKPVEYDLLQESITTLINRATVINSVIRRVTKKNERNNTVSKEYFYSLVEQSIHSSKESALQILVCIAFRNRDKILSEVQLAHQQDASAALIALIKRELRPDEYITSLSDFDFALLLMQTDNTSFEQRLEKIRSKLNATTIKFGQGVEPDTCCAGLVLSNELGSIDQAFKLSKQMMFNLFGRHDQSIHLSHEYQQAGELSPEAVEDAIDFALDNQHLYLSYQPIIDIDGSEKIFEGLARIRDKEENTIMPGHFLPHLMQSEEHIERFNRALVQSAIDDLTRLRGPEAEEVEIIIKLIMMEKSPSLFLSWVSNVMHVARIRGKNRLIFSVSEEDAMKHPDRIEQLHQSVSDLHCSFLLDHAGASEHTQSILDKGHFEYVKLCSNVVKGLKAGNTTDQAFVKSLLKRNIWVIAPFIEDNASFSLLWKAGIRYFQGFFVRRPEPSLHFDFKSED